MACDVTRGDEVESAFAGLGPVDVLVNSAGITGKTNVPSHETDPADVERVFRVNFFGAYHAAKAVLPGMIERGYGRVLHVASIAGKEGNAGMLAYSASKAAVIGMAKVQGKEVRRHRGDGERPGPRRHPDPPRRGHARGAGEVHDRQDPHAALRDARGARRPWWSSIVSPACSFTTGFTFDLSGGRATY